MEPVLVHDLLSTDSALATGVAVVDGERRFTYDALSEAVAKLAGRLQAGGLQRGDRAVILLPKSFEECVAIFGVSKAAGVFVPISPLARSAQIRFILADSGAHTLVTSRALLFALGNALEGLSELKQIIAVDDPTPAAPRWTGSAAIGEDLAAILYTSGSTGSPKGVMLSHRNLLAGTRIVRTYLEITHADRILSILPFSFDYGLNQLLTAIEQGAQIVLLPSFKFGDEIVRSLERHQITGLAGVPTIWAILTRAAPALARTVLPHLRYVTNSGGAMPSETVTRLRRLLPTTRVFLMYGLTEAFRSTFLPPEELDRRPTSIGQAIPETEVFLVTQAGARAGVGEPGILVHRGPTVSLGYWKRPDDTSRILKIHPFLSKNQGGDTVCYSGDIATMDSDGFLYFVGRDDSMIKSAGHRISPTEIEEVLMATGYFRQVAIIGLPDRWVGQRVHAIASQSSDAVDIAHALRTAADKLPSYMVPTQIEIVDTMPTTANGKIDYKTLVAERSS